MCHPNARDSDSHQHGWLDQLVVDMMLVWVSGEQVHQGGVAKSLAMGGSETPEDMMEGLQKVGMR